MFEITNEDCNVLMKRYPDQYFDLAIVDPPYGLKWNSTGGNSLKPHESEKANKWDFKPGPEYFMELKRIAKDYIVWGGNHFFDILGNCPGLIVWDKKQRGMHFADAEIAWCSIGGAVRVIDIGIAKAKNEIQRIHPTQKPIELYREILKRYAKPGFKLLDTFIGSGTIACACHDLGFDLVGCELDPEYYAKAMHRISEYTSQGRMF